MRERVVEIKITKKQFCYREHKFTNPDEQKCVFGYDAFQDTCINCRWYGENIFSADIIGQMQTKEGDK